jgi:hypothetical protein
MRNRFFLPLSGLALVLSTACNQDLTSINTNPNSPTSAPPGPVFTRATNLAVARWLGYTYDQYSTEVLTQHLAEVQYPDVDAYRRLDPASTGGVFNAAYSSELEDLAQVTKVGNKTDNPFIWGPALVMRTWSYGYLTDSWGAVPYSQATSGDSSATILSPAYDPQKAIYTDFFAQLDKVSKQMASANVTLPTLAAADPIYGGSTAKWQKFANSLRARYAMRVVNVDPALASAQLTAAFAAPGGVFTSSADAAKLTWPGDNVYNNPFDMSRDDRRVSNRLVDPLMASNDPRLAVFAQPTVADPTKYAGLPNGMLQAQLGAYVSTTSRQGKAFFTGNTSYGNFGTAGAARPSYLMSYAELAFIQAEAAARSMGGLTPSQAQGFYNAAITASMSQWGVTDAAAIAAYLARPEIAYQGGTPGLKQIAVQKWIALYGDGGQAWFEWRRTCQPNTIKPGPEAIQATVPRRLMYSPNEYLVNETNVRAAVQAQGADDFNSRTWWDTAPTTAPTYEAGCGTRGG